jgi:hypothetical protein
MLLEVTLKPVLFDLLCTDLWSGTTTKMQCWIRPIIIRVMNLYLTLWMFVWRLSNWEYQECKGAENACWKSVHSMLDCTYPISVRYRYADKGMHITVTTCVTDWSQWFGTPPRKSIKQGYVAAGLSCHKEWLPECSSSTAYIVDANTLWDLWPSTLTLLYCTVVCFIPLK